MKKFILSLLLLVSVSVAFSQDQIIASNLNSEKLTIATANPTTGAVTSGFTNLVNINRTTAAIGYYGSYVFYLGYGEGGEGGGEGEVGIFSVNTNGSDHQLIDYYDVNGDANDQELGFVRLGIDKNGVGWIIAKRLYGNQIYLARFQANGTNGGVTNFQRVGLITVSDGDNDVFENGDLALDGKGTLFALANDGDGKTKIYTINPTSSTVLQYKWTLKTSANQNFSGRVNGVAFSSTGSLFISSDDGLWFIDQSTTNFAGTGTVKVSLVKSTSGLADLASKYWPEETRLPSKTVTNLKARFIVR